MLKQLARRALRKIGYDIHHFGPAQDAYHDISELIGGRRSAIAFDVGANTGQTVAELLHALNAPIIHAFEPGAVFSQLQSKYAGRANIHLNDFALGSAPGSKDFMENSLPTMSSFLMPGKDWFGKIERRTPVDVSTLDIYCTKNRIASIDILKCDTQGYDLEVLKGGMKLIRESRIKIVHLEIALSDLYQQAPRFAETEHFMTSNGFALHALYRSHVANGRAIFSDALYLACSSSSVAAGPYCN